MAGRKGGEEEFVYRISTSEEWEALQKTGTTLGGELDKTNGFIHLSNLHQVQSTLQNFFLNSNRDLYLLQIESKKGSLSFFNSKTGAHTFGRDIHVLFFPQAGCLKPMPKRKEKRRVRKFLDNKLIALCKELRSEKKCYSSVC